MGALINTGLTVKWWLSLSSKMGCSEGKNDFKNGRLGADKRRTAWDDEPDEELDEAAGFAALSSVYKKSMSG